MGSLALWGGIAGAGKGIQANAENQFKLDAAKLEEQKEARMVALRAQYDADSQKRTFEHDDTSRVAEIQSKKDIVNLEKTTESADTQAHITSTEKEGAADRASREKVARMNAFSRTNAKMSGPNAKRWESKTIKTTDLSDPRMPKDVQTLSLFDKTTGRTYNQEGDRFFPQGIKSEGVKHAARSEIDKLVQNPDQIDNFLRTYKYLPIEFFNAQPGQGGDVGTDTSSDEESGD